MTPRSYDRTRSFGGGVDMYNQPTELQPNQYALGLNLYVKDSFSVITRPGFDLLDSNPGGSFAANVTPLSPVQALFYFQNPTYSTGLLFVIEGGLLFVWNGSTWAKVPGVNILSANVLPDYAQGINAMIITDGSATGYPIYWDGAGLMAGNFYNYTATDGAFLQGCTICCFVAGQMILAGNPAYPDTIFVSAVLNYAPVSKTGGATGWNSTTLSMQIGNGDGEAIVAVVALQALLCAVLKENSVYLVDMTTTGQNPALPTQNWTAQQQGNPVSRGVGCVGRDAWALYENDLLFMSKDGVQSLQRMEAAVGQYELTEPLSRPIQPLIDRINWSAASVIKTATYNQFVLFFVPLDTSSTNNYVLVWNGRLLSWNSHWTNVNAGDVQVTLFNKTLQLVYGDNVTGQVNLWKDASTLQGADSTYLDNGQPIPCQINTRSFVFGDFDAEKKLRAALMRFNQGDAQLTLTAFADLVDDDSWGDGLNVSGDILGVGTLPFLLESTSPTKIYRSLEGLPYCNEVYFQICNFTNIDAPNGWFELRNVTAVAFMKTVRDPNA